MMTFQEANDEVLAIIAANADDLKPPFVNALLQAYTNAIRAQAEEQNRTIRRVNDFLRRLNAAMEQRV